MNSCGILSNPWLVSQRTLPFLAGTVCREIGALRFVASTTVVAFLGLLRVGYLNFFCTSRWVLMRIARSRVALEVFMKEMVLKSGDASLGRCVGQANAPMRAIWFWTFANHSGLPSPFSA